MQNNLLSFIAVLCLSTALCATSVSAQESEKQNPAAEPTTVAATENSAQNTPSAPVDPAKEAQKKALEAELSNTNVNTSEILDFPGRTSLGELEMATLPGVNESIINGPTPMAPSVSTKDLPSEQLLGRITSEVFQEMADLERGNVFLKLQMQKEQLKNDLEKLKATYRQTRLDEIAKREDVVRSRINWWQEQENVRLEMEKKKAETEAVEQQIAEAEELRNKLRAEAMEEKETAAKEAESAEEKTETVSVEEKETVQKEEVQKQPRAAQTYSLVAVKGVKNNLTANLMNLEDNKTVSVKVKDVLPAGFVVEAITKDSITLKLGDKSEVLLFNALPASTEDSSGK